MRMNQLWQFCKDCKLPTPSLPIADINRIFQKIQRAHLTEVEVAKQKRQIKESGETAIKEQLVDPIRRKMSNTNVTLEGDMHDPDRPILYREFMESVVRIADVKFMDEVDVNLEKRNLAWKVLTMFHENVKENTAMVMKGGNNTNADNFSHKLFDPTVLHVFESFKAPLSKIFTTHAQDDKNSLSISSNDSTMSVREYLLMLRHFDMITPEFTLRDARSIFVAANYVGEDVEEDADNLESEMIFSEFKGAIARIANVIGPAEATLHDKIEYVIQDLLLPGSNKFDTGVSVKAPSPTPTVEEEEPQEEPQEEPAEGT